MRILVVGSGGREHALVWRLLRDGHTVLAAPGNPGIAAIAECLEVAPHERAVLVRNALEQKLDLAVIGPEAPLVEGLADELRRAGIPVFGPGASGARLEGSKIFGKEFFVHHGIRTAPFFACQNMKEVEAALAELGAPVVVKADGLAAGKGVFVCDEVAEARKAARSLLEDWSLGEAGRRVVVEKRIFGQELSVMALCDGRRYEVLAPAEDHKTIFDGDRGPNTGGMGTVSPAPWAKPTLLERVHREILWPTVKGLVQDGIDYRGVLYAGLMIDSGGQPWLLEYNCRFGDPETQPVMARVRGDLGAHLLGAAIGHLPETPLEWDERTAVCVVLAAAGYPGKPETGATIGGLSDELDQVVVFHAGTAVQGGQTVVAGGRVLGVTALGKDVEEARARAYQRVETIHFEGKQFRRDIGARNT